MKKVKDFFWKPGMSVEECVDSFDSLGYQAVELNEASNVILKMKRSGAKIFLTFTSNMVTSGLRGFFSQLVRLVVVDVLVTTSGSIEEDIMKSLGENFGISNFNADDLHLHEKGENRIGNLIIRNESYMKFEDKMGEYLEKIYEKHKRISTSDLLKEVGLLIEDKNSILYQAAKNNVPIFCPAIADSPYGDAALIAKSKGFKLVIDNIKDYTEFMSLAESVIDTGVIYLGGGVPKDFIQLFSRVSGRLRVSV